MKMACNRIAQGQGTKVPKGVHGRSSGRGLGCFPEDQFAYIVVCFTVGEGLATFWGLAP